MSTPPATLWQLAKPILGEALEIPPGPDRDAFISARCTGHPDLLAEVNALLRAADSSSTDLRPDLDAWLGLTSTPVSLQPGDRIGNCRIERLLSQGSSAAVYLARQIHPDRPVALKVLRDPLPLLDSAQRFQREAQALARLNHPHIARIYHAGLHPTPAGPPLPFLVMEYVDGVPATHAARGLTTPRIVRLLIHIASAVHAAHQQTVIHRDLKPANVLVDSTGNPKILDFGIARVTSDEHHLFSTTAGFLLGTPGYMSPEQARGDTALTDVRTDVYALGVLLYEMLAHRLPVDPGQHTLPEVIRRIAAGELTPLHSLRPDLPRDLLTIVATALATETHHRYPSALALADDLARFLNHQPLLARPPSPVDRIAKFARRHRLGVSLGATLALFITAAIILLVLQFNAARLQRDHAAALNRLLRDLIASPDPAYGDRNARMLDVLSAAEARYLADPSLADPLRADLLSALGSMYFGLGEYDRARNHLADAVRLRPPNSPAALDDQNRLTNALRWLARTREAADLNRHTLNAARSALGPHHPTTLAALDLAAGLLTDTQRLDEAVASYRALYPLTLRHLGPTHPLTLSVAASLAHALAAHGHYDQAIALNRQTLQTRLSLGQAASLDTLTLRHNLATNLLESGQTAHALDELRPLAADAVLHLGPHHELTLQFQDSLAEALRRAGQPEEALQLSATLLDHRIASLGLADPRTTPHVLAHAAALLRLERHRDAHALLTRALAAPTPDPLDTTRLRQHLAAALAGLGSHDEAHALYTQAVAELASSLGNVHPHTLVARNNFALALLQADQPQAALDLLQPLLEDVLAARLAAMEPVIRRNLGHALLRTGQTTPALAQLALAYDLSVAQGQLETARKTARLLSQYHDTHGPPDQAQVWSNRALP